MLAGEQGRSSDEVAMFGARRDAMRTAHRLAGFPTTIQTSRIFLLRVISASWAHPRAKCETSASCFA
jgi:hypothetical protein